MHDLRSGLRSWVDDVARPPRHAAFCEGRCWRLVALVGALSTGCGGTERFRPPPPLSVSFSLEDVEVRRGEVRIAGPLELDGAAATVDVVDPCQRRVIGRGIWTSSRLVWWLTPSDFEAALSCGSGLGLSARRSASDPSRSFDGRAFRESIEGANGSGVSTTLSLRLELSNAGDEEAVGIENVALRQEGHDVVVSAASEEPSTLRLAVLGTLSGPTEVTDENAEFHLPTATLVAAALRGESVRLAGPSGTRHASAQVTLFVEDRAVSAAPANEVAGEEVSEE